MLQLLFSTWFIEWDIEKVCFLRFSNVLTVLFFEGLREDRDTLRNEYCAKNILLFHQESSKIRC